MTSWTVAHQAAVSMEFSRQEYWSCLSFPTLGNFPKPRIEPTSLVSAAMAGRFLIYWATCETPKFISSVQFSCSVVSDSATPWTAARQASCPSPTTRVYSNSCPLSQWCHPTITSSVVPFSCLQSFLAAGSFPMNQFFTSGGQIIGVSASASILPMNIQDWYPLWRLVGSLCSPGDSQESSSTPQFKSINSLVHSFLCSPTLTSIHDHWKNHSLD